MNLKAYAKRIALRLVKYYDGYLDRPNGYVIARQIDICIKAIDKLVYLLESE